MSIPVTLQDLGSWRIEILRDTKLEWGEGGGGGLGAKCAGEVMTNRSLLLTETLTEALLSIGTRWLFGNVEPLTGNRERKVFLFLCLSL